MNTQWKGISIRDKVEGTREIPATPYVLHLLATLPRRNDWVFSSTTSADGRLTEPNNAHTRACQMAGLNNLTPHGLRRSFKSLTEWLEIPAGVWRNSWATNPARPPRNITPCARLTCYACTMKKSRPGFWSSPGLCLMPRLHRVRCAWWQNNL